MINPLTVELKLLSLLGLVHPVFHSSLLKPVEATRIRPLLRTPGPVGAGHYEIDKILDSWLHNLVRWKGYPAADASWVPERDIKKGRHLLCLPGGPLVKGSRLSSPVHGLAIPGEATR